MKATTEGTLPIKLMKAEGVKSAEGQEMHARQYGKNVKARKQCVLPASAAQHRRMHPPLSSA
jgi:hypothetical protein